MKDVAQSIFKLMVGASLVLGTSAALVFSMRGGEAMAAQQGGGSGPYRLVVFKDNSNNQTFYLVDTRSGKLWYQAGTTHWTWKPSPPDFRPNVQ